jgi:polyhydroxyalkanoate synthesis regulator phasin
MKTAENTATDQAKPIKEQLAEMFYLGVGICAVAKEKMEEVVDEFKANNPETIEKGEKIVNDLIDEARQAAEKLSDDIKKKYSDIKETATGFANKEKASDEEEDDVWADKDREEHEEDPEETDLNEDEADDDDDLDYVNDDDDEADLENDEFEDEDAENGKEMKDEYPRQHEANQESTSTTSPEVNVPPNNSEMSGNDVDGANGENPTKINPVM